MKFCLIGLPDRVGDRPGIMTGVGKYASCLAEKLESLGETCELISVRTFRNRVLSRINRYVLFPFWLRFFLKKDFDVVILVDESSAFFAPFLRRYLVGTIVHDVRDHDMFVQGLASRRDLLVLHRLERSLRFLRFVLTPSDFTRKRLSQLAPTEHLVLRTVPNLFHKTSALRRKEAITCQGYLLFVTSTEKRKNLGTAMELSLLAWEKFGLHSVFVGIASSGPPEEKGSGESFQHFYSGVDELELGSLYTSAFAFVNTSVYEGFGRTVIEAQLHGCPVVSTVCSSLDEVLMGSCLRVEKPLDLAEYVRALESLKAPEVRQIVISRGKENCKRFDWALFDLEPFLSDMRSLKTRILS